MDGGSRGADPLRDAVHMPTILPPVMHGTAALTALRPRESVIRHMVHDAFHAFEAISARSRLQNHELA